MNSRPDLSKTDSLLHAALPFFAAMALCFATGLPASAQQVSVMQWNVHGNLGTAAAQSSAGAAAIARILNYLQPDVLLINEVADGSVGTNTTSLTQWTAANLPYLASGTFYVAVSTESSSIQRNAVVSRYPVLNPFTYPDVTTSLRGMHSFQLQLAGTNQLHVFHVHLKCCSDGSSCQEKQDEAQLFSDEISAWAATNSTPYIFAGDLNEDESNPECPLTSTYHPITTLITNGGLAEFKPTTLSGEYRTWSTAPTTPSIRFDYILAATNRLGPTSGFVFSTMDWAAHGLYTNASPQNLTDDTRTASDHYSVLANYSFPTNPPPSLQSIQTVFLIMMENHNWSSIKGSASAPYINNTLLPMASHAEQYYTPPANHPSLPNYLWLEAGTNYGILDDNDPSVNHQNTTNHLVTLLKNAGISWRAYQEDICGCFCPLVNTNLYAVRHEPMAYFDDVSNTNNFGSAYCIANIRPYAQLSDDLRSNVVARYNFITPNLCDDMHNSAGCVTTDSIGNGDTWLSNNLPAILNSPAYANNGAIFITWDEGAGSTSDGPLGMIVLSPLAKGAGYSNTIHYTHSSTLRTMQEIFNVGALLGDAANATNLSDLFNFSAAQLSVSPVAGLSATGFAGGPFSPPSQTYTLTNSGSVTLSWTATNNVNWLTLSAVSGALPPGSTAVVTVSINTNANNLAVGAYSDAVSFSNTTSGVGNATRAVNLTVNNPTGQLTVTPLSGLGSAGPPGGPFSPSNQSYTLGNSGGGGLGWTASKTANWLTFSATNGTLAPGSNTSVTVSLNANANSFSVGSYLDTVSFVNTTNGAGNATRGVTLTIATFGFYDDFSAFAAGDLVGQANWTQLGAISTLPLQVSSGRVGIPFGQSVDSQDAYKNFTRTNSTVFYGLALTVSNAPASTTTAPSYFAALYTSNNAAGFANYRLSARDNGSGAYVLAARITGQSGDPYTFGSSALTYATEHRVIVEADSGGTVMKVFVDPNSSNLAAQTGYLTNNIGTGTAPLSVGSFVISQFASGTAPNVGLSIGKVVVADNFAAVYNDLTASVPPPVASFSANPLSGTELLAVTFTDTSTGSVTNRSWNFGDNTTTNLSGTNVAHTYSAGVFTVTLVASGPSGSSTNLQPNYITALTAFQSWQIQYFGSTNNPDAAPNADPDGDGMNNLAEFLVGTNPTNSASVFRITAIAQEGNDVRVTWTMGSGKTNALQVGPGQSFSNNFTDLAAIITAGTVTNYLDAGAVTSAPARFYRVRLGP